MLFQLQPRPQGFSLKKWLGREKALGPFPPQPIKYLKGVVEIWDHYTFLGNCPPTPPLSQHFALSDKQVLMLT